MMKEFSLYEVSQSILTNLRENASEIVTGSSLSSPRAVGDAVQDYLAERGLEEILSSYGIDVSSEFGRRAMEDMAFKDSNGNYYAVDVKTHNLDTEFNMPNLISVKRLATFYKNDDRNNFCILIISYRIMNEKIEYVNCHFKKIESFDWSCLTIGALGWGQIQIANANNLIFNDSMENGRRSWMLTLCDRLSSFYEEEISKIGERETWFATIRDYWERK
ncbi:MAG TPA: hypothetical protein DDY68_04175 [Porphyromonadaceae bacterium]|nr:hypothetical protein [Porphyromonadaceae bacterium]